MNDSLIMTRHLSDIIHERFKADIYIFDAVIYSFPAIFDVYRKYLYISNNEIPSSC